MLSSNYSVVPENERKRRTALLLIDLINDFKFEGGDRVADAVTEALPRIEALLKRARQSNAAVIYANDNIGRWRSRFDEVIDHCLRSGSKGKQIVETLLPSKTDYLILKPGHTGFHATPLEILLRELGTENLILAGQLVNSCVFFTAHDAHMRGFELTIASDGVAGLDAEDIPGILEQMEKLFDARILQCEEIRFDE
ncbi:MAG: cysteine hydrolase [Acidobacteria bacterium]|nr:cysteine hydrolase [Acidobacteriota bacterium]